MNKLPKVLIACPTAEEKDYCFDEWSDQVRNFTYPNYRVLMVDNSLNPNYVNRIAEAGLNCVRFPRQGHPTEWLTMCQNIIRQYFLEMNYDFLFMLESDVFVPKNIIEYMLAFRHPVHNISYFVNLNRNNKQTSLCAQQTTFTKHGRVTRMLSPQTSFEAMDGKIRPFTKNDLCYDTHVSHTGIGCAMIHRSVLEMLDFRSPGKGIYSDTYFHQDLERLGVPNFFDTTIIAKHNRHGRN